MDPSDASSGRGEATREALLHAATLAFASEGFHAVSLRDIALRGGVNPALIGYHFRNKEGLYRAVFERIVGHIQAAAAPARTRMAAFLASPPRPDDQDEALATLHDLLGRMAWLFTTPETEAWALLIVREHQLPTAAFEVVFEGFMRPTLETVSALVARIRPGEPPEACRILALHLVSQVMILRIARAGLLRHLGWAEVGPAELEAWLGQVRRNTTTLLLGA